MQSFQILQKKLCDEIVQTALRWERKVKLRKKIGCNLTGALQLAFNWLNLQSVPTFCTSVARDSAEPDAVRRRILRVVILRFNFYRKMSEGKEHNHHLVDLFGGSADDGALVMRPRASTFLGTTGRRVTDRFLSMWVGYIHTTSSTYTWNL